MRQMKDNPNRGPVFNDRVNDAVQDEPAATKRNSYRSTHLNLVGTKIMQRKAVTSESRQSDDKQPRINQVKSQADNSIGTDTVFPGIHRFHDTL